jgi:S-adenosylmethionine:tRNA-ribosyltransferase-isomerase (queuine synthetase)
VNVSDFDFDLPEALIAQNPPAERGGSRLLVLRRSDGTITHAHFAEIGRFMDRGDLLVVNDTRVFPARLLGHRVPSGGAVECLLVRSIPQSTNPKSQIPNPKAQIPNPKAQIPKPKAHIPSPEAQIPKPEAQIPKPEARRPKPRVQIPMRA